MKTILHEIIENKKLELSAFNNNSIKHALQNSKTGIISEFKRRSPSKGWINQGAQIENIIPSYISNGAAACSILTDTKYFGGNLDDLYIAHKLKGSTPLLRKDFIVEPFQVYQSKIMGADVILLIASCLTKKKCYELAILAKKLHLEVLLEIHNESEIDYITPNIDLVGINNRNLGTFHTDINNSFKLAKKLNDYKNDFVLISESGISTPEAIIQLRDAGFRGFLIGETFMRESAPGIALHNFINQIV